MSARIETIDGNPSAEITFEIRGVPAAIERAVSDAVRERRHPPLTIKQWLALMDLSPDSPLLPLAYEAANGWDRLPTLTFRAHARKVL